MIPATNDSAPAARLGRPDAFACLLLVLLNLLWLKTLHLGFFLLDDPEYVLNNEYVFCGLTPQAIWWAITTTAGGFWFPLTWLSLQLDATIFGVNPWGYHLTNVLFHIVNTLLVYRFFRVVVPSRGWRPALFAAALFSIHPQRVESVAWITERKDMLAFFFGMLTVLAYFRYARSPSRVRYGVVLVAYLASLLSKPMLVTLPAVLLLFDFYPIARLPMPRWWPLIREKIPLLLLGIAMSLNTYMIQFTAGSLVSSWPVRLKNALLNAFLYPRDFFYTGRLVIVNAARPSIPLVQVIACAVFVLLLGGSLLVLFRRKHPAAPALIVGCLWFYIILIPMSGLLQSGINIRADRFSYFPEVGLLLAVVYGLPQLLPFLRLPRFVPAFATVWIVALTATLMLQRLALWQDPLALFEHDLLLEDNAVMNEYAGTVANDRGFRASALQHYRRAGELEPGLRYLYPLLQSRIAAEDAAASSRPASTAP